MEEEKQLIETQDENGNIVSFELFDIVEFEDKEYAGTFVYYGVNAIRTPG